MAMLTITNFSKRYKGGKKAVDGLNLTVEAGDIFGFIGHNGAGKTTTIRAIAGVLDFEEGDIRVDGVSVKEDPVACKRLLAYIPDNPDPVRPPDRHPVPELYRGYLRAWERRSGRNGFSGTPTRWS